jgi:glycosyltransferase involved in cell wall biosynthesis
MIIVVLSYNRGRFLELCVESIEHCAPHLPVCIIDDDSDDPETLHALDRIERRHRVVRGRTPKESKHGGLYANMQLAIEMFADEPLMLTLQDDVQMVRPIDAQDERGWRSFLDRHPDSAFLNPCFLRGISRDKLKLRWDAAADVYWAVPTKASAGVHYSDLHITRPGRLLEHDWQFRHNEPTNDRQAAERFGPMAYLHAPVAMWLPLPPAYRGRKKTLALRIAERRTRMGFYPFDYLDSEAVTALRQRPSEELPIAEDLLTNPAPKDRGVWRYDPLQGQRWLKKLNSLEVRLGRLFR